MNKHFEDTRYYLKRAGEEAKRGVKEELEPIEERVRELTGNEDDDPEPGRFDSVRADLEELEKKAEGEAREALAEARERLKEYRESRQSA
ncbi:MAG: hypothetical protein ABEJ48_09865 [Halobacteriales archaeon]